METEDLALLIMKAAREFNTKMQKQAYERASPLNDSCERDDAPPLVTRVFHPVETAAAPADARWSEQIKERLAVRRLDLERRRAGNSRRSNRS